MTAVTQLPTLAAREAAKTAHPSVVSKQLPPAAVVAAVAGTLQTVERQQALGALVQAIGDDRIDAQSDTDLPLIVMTLLVTCPQVISQPGVVAKVLVEAAAAHRRSVTAQLMGCDDDARRDGEDAAYLTAELVRGEACTATHEYLMADASMLRDWLATAATR